MAVNVSLMKAFDLFMKSGFFKGVILGLIKEISQQVLPLRNHCLSGLMFIPFLSFLLRANTFCPMDGERTFLL